MVAQQQVTDPNATPQDGQPNGQPATPDSSGLPFASPQQPTPDIVQAQIQEAQDAGVPREQYEQLLQQFNTVTQTASENQKILDKIQELADEQRRAALHEQIMDARRDEFTQQLNLYNDVDSLEELAEKLSP